MSAIISKSPSLLKSLASINLLLVFDRLSNYFWLVVGTCIFNGLRHLGYRIVYYTFFRSMIQHVRLRRSISIFNGKTILIVYSVNDRGLLQDWLTISNDAIHL